MNTDGEKEHYFAVKRLSTLSLLTSNHNGDFYFLNCFHSYSSKNKLKKHIKVCENHGYCYVEMSKEDNKILKYNHGEKPVREPFVIYADLECLLEKTSTCHNNSEKSSATKINKYAPSCYSFLTYSSFDTAENKLNFDRGKNCLKNFSLDLKKHVTKMINYKKKEIILLTKKEEKNA